MAFAFIEAGEISQNVHLICTALGIGPCDVGGYAKQRLEQTLGLDGLSEHVIHLTVIGN
jgi:SagB-type dehydrogenase family enzyme